jgi:hypothetical protein
MLSVIRPDFEVVKEGRILHFVSGYRKFEFAFITYNEKSYLVDKRFEISNQILIRDMAGIIKLEEVLSIGLEH